MKTLNLLIAFILISFSSFAQNEKSEVVIQKGIDMMETAKSMNDYGDAGVYFEKIGIAQPNEWLPKYYAAYVNLIYGLKGTQDQKLKDEFYDKALRLVAKADSIAPNNSEIYTLNAYITFMTIVQIKALFE